MVVGWALSEITGSNTVWDIDVSGLIFNPRNIAGVNSESEWISEEK
jgi:hypothetical protein